MIRRIEEAALNSWPALQQVLHDGWLVRFADGYTKRANSVNPLYESVGDTTRNVEFCEALYAERAMPAIFRLTPLAPPDLDGILAARGYARIDSTLVLQRSPGGEAFPTGACWSRSSAGAFWRRCGATDSSPAARWQCWMPICWASST